MTPEQFCYWLQGFLEVTNANQIGECETTQIRNHLATVFKKVTPEVKPTEVKTLLERMQEGQTSLSTRSYC